MLKTIIFEDQKKMYITDDPLLFKKLDAQGKEVIPCINPHDGSDGFPFTKYAVSDIASLFESSYLKDTVCYGHDFIPDYITKIHQRLNGIPWDILKTEHLAVRETTIEDVPRFYEIYSDPAVTKYMEDLFPDPAEEIEYTRNYIEKIYGFYGYGIWTVTDKTGNTVIGRAGITDREGYDTPELGFLIDKAYRQKGYACEVCSAILDYAKEELGFSQIRALVKPDNSVSIHLLEKLGFVIPRTPHQGYLAALRTLS